jgi:pimeloyl-ACP methyl ester carboxylesterase
MELVRVETTDGVWLDGLLEPGATTPPWPLDACLLVHGTGSNFYSPGVLEVFARQARAAGLATLRINTRGHDGLCTLRSRSGSRPGGAAHELIGEAPFDLTAWLDWLVAHWPVAGGHPRVVLVGHSMGAVKSLLLQAQSPHAAVRRVVAISPPRFHHATWQRHPQGKLFRQDYQRAAEMVARGEGHSFFTARQPLPYVTTAAGYLEKYGPEDRYDFVPHLPKITSPTLLLVGERSEQESPAFAETVSVLQHDPRLAGKVTMQRVPQADIGYRHDPEAPWRGFRDWITASPAPCRPSFPTL